MVPIAAILLPREEQREWPLFLIGHIAPKPWIKTILVSHIFRTLRDNAARESTRPGKV